jgi:hypothetical protein
MWVKAKLRSTLLIENADFPDGIHLITDCYIRKNPTAGDRDQILFENSGDYYIAEGKFNDASGAFQDSTPLGFFEDYTISDPRRRYYVFREFNTETEDFQWYLTVGNRLAEWLVLENSSGDDEVLQEGYWKLDLDSKKWIPQKLSNSKNPPSFYEIDDFEPIGAQLWKSKESALTGEYEWNGVGSVGSIFVGWKTYTYTGGIATETINLIEVSNDYWNLDYSGETYEHSGPLPLVDFTMISTTTAKELLLSFEKQVELSKSVYFFDGQVQSVV